MTQYFTQEMAQWRDKHINQHLCKCGCGQFVQPTRWRWYNGKNLDYLVGHDPSSHSSAGNNHKWKGGRLKRNGYVFVLFPTHPNADSKGYVREHRLIVERKLGRYLRYDEYVHHINGNKSDNHPTNLEVLSKSQHHTIHAKHGKDHFNWVDVDVEKLRQLKEEGLTNKQIAITLGISLQTVNRRLHPEKRY